MRKTATATLPIVLTLLLALVACTAANGSTTQGSVQGSLSNTLVGAGDIASCTSSGDEAVANVLDGIEGTVFTLGDNVYQDGTASEFSSCYGPSWGRHKGRTRPVPGNHDYNTAGAVPYYNYFSPNAGNAGEGYYSYDLASWHIITLNSNCSAVACGATSAQQNWLRADLAASDAECAIAMWHHPVVTIGPHPNDEAGMLSIWRLLYDNNVDIVMSGHEHNYQRYAPLNREANGIDANNGMRFFVVGTGGAGLTNASASRANSTPGIEVWADQAGDTDGHDANLGVLKLTLTDGAYAFQFVPVAGGSFTDSGQGVCHSDADGDTVRDAQDNCPEWANAAQDLPPWLVAANDPDCDGFTTAVEGHTGTDPAAHCNATETGSDESPDAWPPDNDDDQTTDISDVVRFGPTFNRIYPDPAYNSRMDLNADNKVTISDVVRVGPYMNRLCS